MHLPRTGVRAPSRRPPRCDVSRPALGDAHRGPPLACTERRARRTCVRNRRYRGASDGYPSDVDIESPLVLGPLALAVVGELLLWLKHRKDVADPPFWN